MSKQSKNTNKALELPLNTILLGNCIDTLKTLPDNSVDCCVTSPPYYALRDYGVDGQIGLEDTPDEFIEKLANVFEQVRRILKPEGTLWVNMGDSYAGSWKGAANYPDNAMNYKQGTNRGMLGVPTCLKKISGYKPKDLIGIPWMLAFALRSKGWYLRQDIIWHKENCMPESVTDRCTKAHEYIFLFSKSRHYHFDSQAIREPAVGFDTSAPRGSVGNFHPNAGRRPKGNTPTFRGGNAYTKNRSFDNSAERIRDSHGNVPNLTGLRNKRSVWNVATAQMTEAHFATFPEKLIQPCILAGCPENGVVLDPFMGSGTTAIVARKLGRNYIGIEINPKYVEMAERRIKEEGEFLF